MPTKALKIDSLDLDLENPRITTAADQRDAMQKIIAEQGAKLVTLAESIASRGFSPIDRFLVVRSHLRVGKFIILEGNRRVLSAKLLKNPDLLKSLQMPEAYRKRLQKAAQDFDVKKIEPVDCFEVSDRSVGDEWIRSRHRGEDAGRGIVDWSPLTSARFSKRYPAMQALDFVLEHGGLSDDEKQLVTAKFPLSTLDRLLSTPTVRSAIGLELIKGKFETDLPPEEILKPLKRIVLDLSDKKIITVTKLKSVKQQEDYVAGLQRTDRADRTKATGKKVPVAGITDKDFAVGSPITARSRAPRAQPRHSVVPRTCKLTISNTKINAIFEELRRLQLSKHVHAIGVLLRVFLEMSVDDYLENKAGSKLTFKEPKSGRMIDKKLRDKVQEAIDHMVARGVPDKELKGISSGIRDPHNPFSIDTLHAYIHNRFFTPTDSHLSTAWDNGQRFFEKIWP